MARAVAEAWVNGEAEGIARKRKAGRVASKLVDARAKVRRLEKQLMGVEEAVMQRRKEAGDVVAKVLGAKGSRKELVRAVLEMAEASATVTWGREDHVAGEVVARTWVKIEIEARADGLGRDGLRWVEWVAEVEERKEEADRRYVYVRGKEQKEGVEVVFVDWDEEEDEARGPASGSLGRFLGASESGGDDAFWREMERPDWEAIRRGKVGANLWGRWASVEASTAGWNAVAEMVASRENVLDVLMKDRDARDVSDMEEVVASRGECGWCGEKAQTRWKVAEKAGGKNWMFLCKTCYHDRVCQHDHEIEWDVWAETGNAGLGQRHTFGKNSLCCRVCHKVKCEEHFGTSGDKHGVCNACWPMVAADDRLCMVMSGKEKALKRAGEARLAEAKHETALLTLEGEIKRGEVVAPTFVVIDGPGIEIE